jgi:uncharacterized protein (DUF1697 family)
LYYPAVTRHVAFLRAVNVGGRTVRMDDLRKVCEAIPLRNVATVIASGNVLFETGRPRAAVEASIEKALRRAFGFEVITMVRSASDLGAVIEHVETSRMPHGAGATLYVGFMKARPGRTAVRAVTGLSNQVDQLSVTGEELYWQCSTSLTGSTIAGSKLEKLLATPLTLRNYNTVRKLAALSSAIRLS